MKNKNKPAAKKLASAKLYRWQAKPPLTRSDVFADCWEFADFWAESDEKAAERISKMFERYNVGTDQQIIKLTCGERSVRTFK